ncbi:hypothetical protein IFM89_012900 [Coptis chinensis]|uniref:Uncharacterized protein n=1 Tax=Coptis chinensis TaxID=261450 RepID=A0A835HB84_9MAGN|nr:hypothetical protein IFM89_012900 [Coptis chinensis]
MAVFYENGPFTMVGIRHQTFCMSTSPMELVSVIVLISATFLQLIKRILILIKESNCRNEL